MHGAIVIFPVNFLFLFEDYPHNMRDQKHKYLVVKKFLL